MLKVRTAVANGTLDQDHVDAERWARRRFEGGTERHPQKPRSFPAWAHAGAMRVDGDDTEQRLDFRVRLSRRRLRFRVQTAWAFYRWLASQL